MSCTLSPPDSGVQNEAINVILQPPPPPQVTKKASMCTGNMQIAIHVSLVGGREGLALWIQDCSANVKTEVVTTGSDGADFEFLRPHLHATDAAFASSV